MQHLCAWPYGSVPLAPVVDKAVGILPPIAAFVACGFEHCVANMYFLPMGILMHSCGYGADVAGADALNAAGLALNPTMATGPLAISWVAPLIVALGYWFIYANRDTLRTCNKP